MRDAMRKMRCIRTAFVAIRLKLLTQLDFFECLRGAVGVTGLEPVTSAMSTRRSSQLS